MQRLSQQSARENAGTTSLGALLRAKLDNNESEVTICTDRPVAWRRKPSVVLLSRKLAR